MENKDIQFIISKKMKEARKAKGLTQAQLAEKINKSVEMVCHLENGTASTRLSTLQEIADVLGVEMYQFFTEKKVFDDLNLGPHLMDLFFDLQELDDETINAFFVLVKKMKTL